jgi:hypothetical protein
MPQTKTAKATGRPTKKNQAAIARILKIARSGLPLKFAAQAGDIDAETLSRWRAKDPEFAQALSQAQLHAVEERWKLIRKAAEDRLDSNGNLLKPGDWKAIAWQLERRYPSDFGRPEVQLNVQNNVQMNLTGEFVITVKQGAELDQRVREIETAVEERFARRQLPAS